MLHKVGNKYKTQDGLIGLLTTFQLDGCDYCMLTTIGDATDLDYRGLNGNRYVDPIKVADPYHVTDAELKQIAGNRVWEPYDNTITI